LLPDVRGGRRARRDRHRVHGQPQRRPLRDEHQRVGQRRRQEGAPVLPLVRPHRRLPHLQDRLEPQEHHVRTHISIPHTILHPSSMSNSSIDVKIRFQVDDVPVRTFKKYDDLPYPSSQPM
uniref:Uncharacterized protein n=1 Tax=Aegilops tauschii subsp. strangulata TaxID=200361 RepID=A0A452ZWH4_AEGTS